MGSWLRGIGGASSSLGVVQPSIPNRISEIANLKSHIAATFDGMLKPRHATIGEFLRGAQKSLPGIVFVTSF